MAKKETLDAPTAADDTPPAAEAVAPRSPRRGLAIAGVVGGGLVVAALLFGAGFTLGSALPHGERAPFVLAGTQQGGTQQGDAPQGGPQQGGPQAGPGGDGKGGPGMNGPERQAPERPAPAQGETEPDEG